jgi:pimeloyl-ACP methyl ester carboxylesterase
MRPPHTFRQISVGAVCGGSPPKLTMPRAPGRLAIGCTTVLVTSVLIWSSAAHAQAPDFRTSCENLAAQADVKDLDFVEAKFIPSAPPPAEMARQIQSAAVMQASLPAHCRINASFERREGNNAKPYEIKLELRVPQSWNGRLLYQGGGAFKGVVVPALGLPASTGSSARLALASGFAVVTSDSGHTGLDASFTDDQLATLNYAYASIGKVSRVAKRMIAGLEGRKPERTYFQGCSNGGREALMAAERFPEEFDGVVAANPAVLWGQDAVLSYSSIRSYSSAAPRDAEGRGQPWLAFTMSDWKVINSAITAQCDAADGLADGMIFNHSTCRFSPSALICLQGQNSGCLTSGKAAALDAAFRGPTDQKGHSILFPWVFDASIGTPEWLAGQMGYVDAAGTLVGQQGPAIAQPNQVLTRLFRYPPVTPEHVASETPEEMLAAMRERMGLIQASSTQLDSFAAKGGKILLVHGWSDPALSPMGLIRWYESLQRDTRAAQSQSADSFARMFLFPGMTHCGGGKSLDDFDALSVLTDWVEKGLAPDSIEAGGVTFPGVRRPVCAYPRFARYKGVGSKLSASSFVCSE